MNMEAITEMTLLIEKVQFEIIDEKEWLKELRKIAGRNGVHIICINNKLITGRIHVKTAVCQALRAFKERRMIAQSLEMEVLLSAAATRQCHEAVNFGVHKGLNNCYLCIISEGYDKSKISQELMNFMTKVDEDWELISEERFQKIIGQYKITPPELLLTGNLRLTELVVERIAMLELDR